MRVRKRSVEAILNDLQYHNFTTVYNIPLNPNKVDLRNKARKETYYKNVVNILANDVENLLVSGIITYEDADSLYGQINNIPLTANKANINKVLEFRRRVLDKALDPSKLNDKDVDILRIKNYLNDDIFYYFSKFAPEASRLIRQLALNNPQEFLRALDNHELPDQWNVSDWDNIVARILENPSFYESEEQQETVRQEMDNYVQEIHKKRPWSNKRRV